MRLSQVEVFGEELALAWADGEESYLSLHSLRAACPCATCQGEPDVRGRVIKFPTEKPRSEQSYRLIRWQFIGGYALQLFWGDGHQSGIYTYELLKSLGEEK